jgi:hypothetical protein
LIFIWLVLGFASADDSGVGICLVGDGDFASGVGKTHEHLKVLFQERLRNISKP